MGQAQEHSTPIHVDNYGAVELAKEQRSCQRSRHVDRRDLNVYEYVAHGCIEVHKIHTDDNVADFFTKSRPTHAYTKHMSVARGI
eukprot:2366742-Pleurochrysis_carterae.AAC.1